MQNDGTDTMCGWPLCSLTRMNWFIFNSCEFFSSFGCWLLIYRWIDVITRMWWCFSSCIWLIRTYYTCWWNTLLVRFFFWMLVTCWGCFMNWSTLFFVVVVFFNFRKLKKENRHTRCRLLFCCFVWCMILVPKVFYFFSTKKNPMIWFVCNRNHWILLRYGWF